MVILHLWNMHFMMRKNYRVLQTSHFGVCELREGEKENILHFSYLFVRIIKKSEKNTLVSGPTTDQSNEQLCWWHDVDVSPPSF